MCPEGRDTSAATASTLLQQQEEDPGSHALLQPGPGDGPAAQHRQHHQGALAQRERPVQVRQVHADPPGSGLRRGDQDPTDQGSNSRAKI